MLEKMIIDLGAFKTGEFTLASGRKSDYYVDLRKAVTDPEFLTLVAGEIQAFTEGMDRIAGVALGAIPIATAASIYSAKPFIMIRKSTKTHGTQKRIEGILEEGDKVLFVEDTTTTAGSLIDVIQCVREAGGVVEKAIVIVDREEGARENLAEIQVDLHSLADIGKLKSLS